MNNKIKIPKNLVPEDIDKFYNKKSDIVYKLDENNNPVNCSIKEFSDLIQSEKKIVKHDYIDNYFISTVFLGTTFGFTDDDDFKPLLFETMVFKDGNFKDIYLDRYATYQEAKEGHRRAIDWVKGGCKIIDDEK